MKEKTETRKKASKRGRPIGSFKGRFLLDDKKEEIKQLLKQNMSMSCIAAQMQVSIFTVHYYLKKHSFLIPKKYQRINHGKLYHKEEFIRSKLKAGVTKAAIARELGVSREALFNKLEQMGWREKNPYRKKKIDLNLFLKAFQEGKTYREMADIFKCHQQTIINKVKELQLSRRKKVIPERKNIC